MKVPVLLVALLLVGAGCGSGGASKPAAQPRFVPAKLSAQVTNPYFPLPAGTTLVYRGVKDGRRARDVFAITGQTKVIQGVRCAAISDRLFLDGRLAERTTDWYAQDDKGNVWYFGESTAELDAAGRVKNTEGSWQSGVDGARAGIFMTARPEVGKSFRQEFYKGQAEDHFEVLALQAPVSVPYGSSNHALLTKEWTPLEPGTIDHKHYLRGIGTAKEETVRGGDEKLELVSVTRRR